MVLTRKLLLSLAVLSAAGRLLYLSVAGDQPVAAFQSADPFVVKPYLQLGNVPLLSATESLAVFWHTADVANNWTVQTKRSNTAPWQDAGPATFKLIAVSNIAAHRVYQSTISGLAPGGTSLYRILRDGVQVFQSTAKSRKAASQPYRNVIYGDMGANTAAERAVAYQTYLANPDMIFFTGDLVYDNGRISEYRSRYFPFFSAATPSPTTGAAITQSVMTIAAPGNHDILTRNLTTYPDGLAYFFYWALPLNGPITTNGAPNSPTLSGSATNQSGFLSTAGPNYPQMANYSFDYGNAHWTVLDLNSYVDWEDPQLRAWVANDLAAAQGATWRFVGIHQPGFNSSRTHFSEQQMRPLANLFEAGNVDIVFAGHVHNYQRSFPLRFQGIVGANGKLRQADGTVNGTFTFDKVFDGVNQTRPTAPIYIVTGAGGQGLYDVDQTTNPASWQPFTDKFISDRNSLTVMDVNGPNLAIKQLSSTGQVIDSFRITK